MANWWRCSGSLVALWTSEAVVPDSNPASLIVENSEDKDMQSHCVYCTVPKAFSDLAFFLEISSNYPLLN